MKGLALLSAVASATAFGAGSVLQKLAADRVPIDPGLHPRLLLRLLRQGQYLLGWTFDLTGYGLQVMALSVLPLFVVQSFVAMSVGVSAVLSRLALGARLSRRASCLLALLAVAGVLLGVSAPVDAPIRLGTSTSAVAAAALAALIAIGWWLARRPGVVQPGGLGALAGAAFAVAAVLGKAVAPLPGVPLAAELGAVLSSPAPYLLAAAGLSGALLYGAGLQRGTVVAVEAPLVAVELVAPAAVGLALLGEPVPAGWPLALAVCGFAAALVGAWGLTHAPIPASAPRPWRAR